MINSKLGKTALTLNSDDDLSEDQYEENSQLFHRNKLRYKANDHFKMGCINSKKDLADMNTNIYRVINVNSDGVALWNGQLEISPRELILHRKGKEPTTWSLQHLRRYGFDADIFTFEAGRRCTTGEGIYAFRCRRAESLFHTLQTYIQGIASNDDNTQISDFTIQSMNGPSNMTVQPRVSRQSQSNSRPNSLTQGQPNSNTNYVIPNSRTQSLSPNGTIHSSNPSRSTDTLATEGNYLEPTPMRNNLGARYAGRLSSVSSGPLSPEPNSPSSPNSFTNILEVTQLNQQQQYQNSNLYQEFPLRSNENNNNLLNKKLSLDIPPQEQAPAVSGASQQQQIIQPLQQNFNNSDEGHMSPHHRNSIVLVSPTENDSSHMYVNVTPGELDGIVVGSGTPTVATSAQINFGFSRFSSTQYSIDPAMRCYENLETGEFRHKIVRNRFSKPDIYKVDFPTLASQTPPIGLTDKSEPSTPTNNIKPENHKVNYIVLDLDQSPSSSTTVTSTITSTTVSSSSMAATTASTISSETTVTSEIGTTTCVTSACSTLQSPTLINSSSNGNDIVQQTKLVYTVVQSSSSTHSSNANDTTSNYNSNNNNNNNNNTIKATPTTPTTTTATSTVSDYATIDFDKTVALSNSTAPSSELDSEGSRKTRHSSTAARHSNSISD